METSSADRILRNRNMALTDDALVDRIERFSARSTTARGSARSDIAKELSLLAEEVGKRLGVRGN